MRVAVLGESAPDEVAIKVLVEGLLGREVHDIPGPPLRRRGWSAVHAVLPTVIKALHYRSSADALIVIVDADESDVHRAAHESEPAEDGCRLCSLRAVVRATRRTLRPRPSGPELRVAVGLAVPALEAWFRFADDPRVTAAAWLQGQPRYTKIELKRAVYGSDRPPLERRTERARDSATRLVRNLHAFEQAFPHGSGPLAREIRSWSRPS